MRLWGQEVGQFGRGPITSEPKSKQQQEAVKGKSKRASDRKRRKKRSHGNQEKISDLLTWGPEARPHVLGAPLPPQTNPAEIHKP